MRIRAVVLLSLFFVLPALAADDPVPSQTTLGSTLTITGEVTAVDLERRHITVRGPLGGELSGRVSDDVKNLDQVKLGDLLTVSYSQSVALRQSRPGEPNPLYKGGDASTAEPGERPGLATSEQNKGTVTVVSVDLDNHQIVLESEDGTVFPVSVDRPEFRTKLETVRPGDKIDVVTTEAVIAQVTPAGAGDKAGMTYTESTLIVERGEVLWRQGNLLAIRNERGRTFKVTVDSKYKFLIDGKEATVADLKPGTRLTRTALRVSKVVAD
jgi:predicted RNA-binding protein